jgi:hypothetical protein
MTKRLVRHPEWKRLIDECAPLAQPGRFFTWDELTELAGIDIRSPKGRVQFQRFRNELLMTYQLWLESEYGRGYRVVQPNEHSKSAYKQLQKARRRVKQGARIAANTRLESLTPEERKAQADVLSRLARLEITVTETQEGVRKLVAEVDRKRLPSPLLDNTPEKS